MRKMSIVGTHRRRRGCVEGLVITVTVAIPGGIDNWTRLSWCCRWPRGWTTKDRCRTAGWSYWWL